MREAGPSSETRRQFITRGAAALVVLGAVRASEGEPGETGGLTIREVIDRILEDVPPGPEDTVDTVKVGDPDQPVTGIVTTFLASDEVIDEAIALGANLVITHEPTFYNHRDRVDWLEGDEVYEHKRRLLETSGIVVWRFHDGIHRLEPDGVIVGVLEELGWQKYARPDKPSVCDIPPATLRELAALFEERLGTKRVLAVGDTRRRYRSVGLMVGAAGGESQMRFLRETGVEVLVVGELGPRRPGPGRARRGPRRQRGARYEVARRLAPRPVPGAEDHPRAPARRPPAPLSPAVMNGLGSCRPRDRRAGAVTSRDA
jgi:putative NIF3 family GTP cyclohydrolase 1 type 2